jgi:hypothetical protein
MQWHERPGRPAKVEEFRLDVLGVLFIILYRGFAMKAVL